MIQLALLLALTNTADAFVFIGNPKLMVEAVRTEGDLTDGQVYLDAVRVHKCGGGYTDYPIDEWIDPVEGWETTISGGDLCGASVKWGSDLMVESSAFELRYEQMVTQVVFASAAGGEEELTPFVVESGSFSGSNPVLMVTLD